MDCLGRILMVGWLLGGAAHALYLGQGVTAYPVANGAIKVDGKPENIWREISTRAGVAQMEFDDYGKIVLLEPVEIRNAPPQEHYQAPANGSVTLLAAYDNTALYFFFLVRENSAFDPGSLCGTADLWKANAAEVYVDPNAWSPTLYPAYFSADAGEATYGTSPKTLQVAKTAWPGDTRKYYRDRTVGDRFELRTPPASQLLAICSTRTRTDVNTLGIEIKVAMPTPADFGAGKSMFISWGYNHYPAAYRSTCDSLPIAYRFAKHYKTYAGVPKPPGWMEGDSTHFDPARSYDGWGRLELYSQSQPITGSGCRSDLADTTWNLSDWGTSCTSATSALIGRPSRHPVEPSGLSAPSLGRDIRGRLAPRSRSGLFILPAAAPLPRFTVP